MNLKRVEMNIYLDKEMKLLEMCSAISTLHTKALIDNIKLKNIEELMINEYEMKKELREIGVSKDNLLFGC